jgi:hypothetical protein
VIDFADVMESFGIRLHTLPREGIVGTLTVLCRVWIGIGLTVLATRKRKPADRRVLTPPGVQTASYWRLRAGALAGMAAVFLATGLVGWLVAGRPAESLAAAVKEGPEGRAEDALRALRRMGPSAGDAVPQLVATRHHAPPAVRDNITRTLGYLGTSAAAPLREIALTEPAESAGPAVDSLAAVGGPAAPDLVAGWDMTKADAVRTRAEAALTRVGGDAVGPLMDRLTPENSHGHYVWLQKLDRNWVLRGTINPTALACQRLPDLLFKANSTEPAEAAAAMGDIRACGTVAREVLDTAFDRLGHRDHALQSASAGVVVAAGPTVTPRVLRLAAAPTDTQPIPAGAITVLNDASMWTDPVYADPNTLPTLLKLVARPDGLQVAIKRLGHYGPAAAPAAPVLVPKVAEPNGDTRAAVRGTLDRIHPKWKADPALTAALPVFLYQLPQLPQGEADELYAAVKDIPPTGADGVVRAVNNQLREVNQQYRGRGVWTKDSPQAYAQALDAVFGPVERLGPKAKVLVPHFQAMIRANSKELNDPKPKIVNARLLKTIPAIGGGSEADNIPITLEALGHGPAGFDFLRRQGKAGLPAITALIDDRDTDKKLFGMRAAAALGKDAAGVVPRLVAALRGSNQTIQTQGNEEVWMLGRIVETLTAIDPDWWAREDAAAPLAELLSPREFEPVATTRERHRALDLVAAAGPRAAPLAPRLAAALVGAGGIDPATRTVLDKLDPKWREGEEVKKQVPTLVGKMALGIDRRNEQTLAALGAVAFPELAAGVEALPAPLLMAGPMEPGAIPLLDRVQVVLTEIGPPAKAATPGFLKLIAKPQLHPRAAEKVFATLDKIDPGWDKAEANKAAVAEAGKVLIKRAPEHPELLALAGRCGVEVVPDLTRRLAAAPSALDKAQVLGMVSTAGRSAKAMAPTVAKLVNAKEHTVTRTAAITALGRVAAGDASWASTLFPGVTDTEPEIRSRTGQALDQVDPEWRTKPAAKQAAAAAVKQLTSAETRKRYDAVGVIDVTRHADAVGPLEQLVAREQDPATKSYAQAVLGRLRKAP